MAGAGDRAHGHLGVAAEQLAGEGDVRAVRQVSHRDCFRRAVDREVIAEVHSRGRQSADRAMHLQRGQHRMRTGRRIDLQRRRRGRPGHIDVDQVTEQARIEAPLDRRRPRPVEGKRDAGAFAVEKAERRVQAVEGDGVVVAGEDDVLEDCQLWDVNDAVVDQREMRECFIVEVLESGPTPSNLRCCRRHWRSHR